VQPKQRRAVSGIARAEMQRHLPNRDEAGDEAARENHRIVRGALTDAQVEQEPGADRCNPF
jgi:hypothetical protein